MIAGMSAACATLLTVAADQDWLELVGTAIGVVIVIGSMVASALKKTQGPKPSARKPSEPPAPAHRQSSRGVPTADEIALRRRQQLEQLIRRGREDAERSAAQPASPQPDNLTVAEAQQRQRAIEQYRRRAEQLQRQREAAAARAQQERLAAQRPQSLRLRRPPPPTPRYVAPAVPAPAPAPVEEEVTHRLVPEAPTAKAYRAPSPLAGLSLRRAFIAKEILDPPLALRDPT